MRGTVSAAASDQELSKLITRGKVWIRHGIVNGGLQRSPAGIDCARTVVQL